MEGFDRTGELKGSLSVPVIVEELEIEKLNRVTASIRVTKSVSQREQVVDVPVLKSTVSIERVPIGKIMDEQPPVRQEGANTTVFPVVEEIAVWTKKYLLKEEVRVSRLEVTEPRSETVMLRSEEITVDRDESSAPASDSTDSFVPFTEGVIHLSETAEEAVLVKRARVIEQLELRKQQSERTVRIEDTVRKTEISIESFDGNEQAG